MPHRGKDRLARACRPRDCPAGWGGSIKTRVLEIVARCAAPIPALAKGNGGQNDGERQAFEEMDLAFLEMFDLLLDIMVRMGVPKEEFDEQFKTTLQKVGKYPQAKFIIERMAKVAAARASDLKDLERISLLHQRPKGSA